MDSEAIAVQDSDEQPDLVKVESKKQHTLAFACLAPQPKRGVLKRPVAMVDETEDDGAVKCARKAAATNTSVPPIPASFLADLEPMQTPQGRAEPANDRRADPARLQ